MKRAWVEFWSAPTVGYLGVHRFVVEKDPSADPRAPRTGRWEPPLPPVPGKGYPRIYAEIDRMTFEFISVMEILEAADVLHRDLVDHDTAKARWYRKLPATVKAAHARHRVAAYLREVAAAYLEQLPALIAMPSPVPQMPEPRPANRPPTPPTLVFTTPLRL